MKKVNVVHFLLFLFIYETSLKLTNAGFLSSKGMRGLILYVNDSYQPESNFVVHQITPEIFDQILALNFKSQNSQTVSNALEYVDKLYGHCDIDIKCTRPPCEEEMTTTTTQATTTTSEPSTTVQRTTTTGFSTTTRPPTTSTTTRKTTPTTRSLTTTTTQKTTTPKTTTTFATTSKPTTTPPNNRTYLPIPRRSTPSRPTFIPPTYGSRATVSYIRPTFIPGTYRHPSTWHSRRIPSVTTPRTPKPLYPRFDSKNDIWWYQSIDIIPLDDRPLIPPKTDPIWQNQPPYLTTAPPDESRYLRG